MNEEEVSKVVEEVKEEVVNREALEELEFINNLNIPERPNVPLCPACTEPLEYLPRSYIHSRINPDTRWFHCNECDANLGYHRMKKKWYIDPSDLVASEKFREALNITK